MTDQQKLLLHFVISKLVIVAVPLLNQLLFALGITVSTSPSTSDNIANCLCIAIGIAYSYWTKMQAEKVHTEVGFNKGVSAALGDKSPPISWVKPDAPGESTKTVTTVLEIPFNNPADSTKPPELPPTK